MYIAEMVDEKKAGWDVEMVLRRINAKGRWQLGQYILLCASYATLAYHFVAFIFQVDTPSHHCAIPENRTKNDTIPQIMEKGKWIDDMCHMYINRSFSNETVKCSKWEFDPNSGYISTIVTDFNLVCGKNILVEIQLMISSLVLSVCQVFSTRLADTYGRKKVFLICTGLRFIFGVAKGFSPNMTTYIIMDALIHVSMSGFSITILVMTQELFPTEYRSLAGTSLEFVWFFSLMYTSMLIWLLRSWRTLQIVMYAPMILSILYYWLLNESIPWLVARKRYPEAEQIIRRGARINKMPIPPDLFNSKATTEEDIQLMPVKEEEQMTKEKDDVDGFIRSRSSKLSGSNLSLSNVMQAVATNAVSTMPPIKIHQDQLTAQPDEPEISTWGVFKSKKMVYITAINFLLWFTTSIIYTVLNLNVTSLSGDRYFNFILLNIAELPAIISFYWALNKIGRRLPVCIYSLTCGVALLLTLLPVFDIVHAPWLDITLNFVGKFAISASYCAILTYTPELYPTNVRSRFFGLCWFWGNVGTLIAPLSRPLERAIPGVVRGSCGLLSIIVGLLVLLLPETLRRPLPKTVPEIEAWTITLSAEERQRYIDNKAKNITECH